MSLLMDALKKAEQEKREAAKRLEEAADRTLTPELDTVSEPEITGELEIAPPDEALPDPAPNPDLPNLSLEPLGEARPPHPPLDFAPLAPEDPTLRMEAAAAPAEEPAPFELPAAAPARQSAREAIDPDLTFEGLAATGRNDVPGLYEPTVQGEPLETAEAARSYDETLPGVSAVQLVKDIGPADQPTPAAAETVFAARGPRGPSATLKWTMIGLTGAAVAAASVGYYVIVTPMTPELPDPWVARGIESVPPPSQPLQPVTQAAVPDETLASGPAAEPPVITTVPAQDEAQPVSGSTSPGTSGSESAPGSGAAPAGFAAGEETPPAPEVPVTETAAESVPPAAAQIPAPVAEGGAAAPRFESAPPPIQITRSSGPPQHARLLREAYASFQSGDFNAARLQYLAVLNDVPDNVDALLGMGAIAMKEKDAPRMAEYFTRVLRLDPRNRLASAALIRLRGGNASGSESAIKNLINGQPDSPFLHFSLGNVYAGQGRWPEAQQAFFDAYRLDSGNPDYALNLAASLDRMGQREAALDYYRVALKLSELRPAGFDPAPILERIEALNAAVP